MPLDKEQLFSVTLDWKKDHEMLLHTREIPDIIVGPPEPFGGKPHYTTAQDLFLGSWATCLTSTFLTLAKLKHLKFSLIKTEIEGVLTIFSPDDVRFTKVTSTMHLAIDNPDDADLARSTHDKVTKTYVVKCPDEITVFAEETEQEKTTQLKDSIENIKGPNIVSPQPCSQPAALIQHERKFGKKRIGAGRAIKVSNILNIISATFILCYGLLVLLVFWDYDGIVK